MVRSARPFVLFYLSLVPIRANEALAVFVGRIAVSISGTRKVRGVIARTREGSLPSRRTVGVGLGVRIREQVSHVASLQAGAVAAAGGVLGHLRAS